MKTRVASNALMVMARTVAVPPFQTTPSRAAYQARPEDDTAVSGMTIKAITEYSSTRNGTIATTRQCAQSGFRTVAKSACFQLLTVQRLATAC